jgi:hypothetical protein
MNGTPGQYDYLLNEKTGIQSIFFFSIQAISCPKWLTIDFLTAALEKNDRISSTNC